MRNPLGGTLQIAIEERRIVTARFCDMIGFRARSDLADPEEIMATLRPFYGLCVRISRRSAAPSRSSSATLRGRRAPRGRAAQGPELVEAYSEVAGHDYVLDAFAGSIEWANKAIDLAHELGVDAGTRALGFRGAARCLLGDASGPDDLREALSIGL